LETETGAKLETVAYLSCLSTRAKVYSFRFQE